MTTNDVFVSVLFKKNLLLKAVSIICPNNTIQPNQELTCDVSVFMPFKQMSLLIDYGNKENQYINSSLEGKIFYYLSFFIKNFKIKKKTIFIDFTTRSGFTNLQIQNSLNTQSLSIVSDDNLLINAGIKYDGVLVGFEVHAALAGSVYLEVFF